MKFKDFLAEKNISEEAFKGMDFEGQAGVYNDYNEVFRTKIVALEEASATKEEIAAVKSDLVAATQKQFDALNEILKEQGIALKRGQRSEESKKTFAEALKDNLEANKEKLVALKNGDKSKAKDSEFSFVVKAVGDMTSANISGGNVPVEERLAGLDGVPVRATRLIDVVSRANATSNLISWVSKANQEGAAGQTAEGSAKNQIDFDLVVDSESMKKTTAYIKVSTEMLDDVDFIMSEIRNELLTELLLKVEAQIYEGDNTGQNLNGIKTQASAFNPSSEWVGGVDNANEIDVLAAAGDQIEVANQPMASAIFMHPTDVNFLKASKVSSTDKRYVDRLVNVAGSLELDGVQIIKTTLVTKGEYLIGYFPYATVYQKGGVTIDIGLDGNDFTKNFRTILAEWRGLNVIKTNKTSAFVTGVFATDKTTLETT